jgi:hypothetical protein
MSTTQIPPSRDVDFSSLDRFERGVVLGACHVDDGRLKPRRSVEYPANGFRLISQLSVLAMIRTPASIAASVIPP